MDEQYAYHNMSGKVLRSKTSGPKESTGEAQSVRGMIGSSYVMGDRIGRGAATDEFKSRKDKGKKKKDMEERGKHLGKKNNKKSNNNNNLQNNVDPFTGPGYRPKTQETRSAYESMMTAVQKGLGDVPQNVLRAGADECLAIIKGNEYTSTKRIEIEKFLGKISDDDYDSIIKCSQRINDFSSDALNDESRQNDSKNTNGIIPNGNNTEIGVAVVFDDEDDSDSDAFEIPDSSEEDSDSDSDDNEISNDGNSKNQNSASNGSMKNSPMYIDVTSIDAYWLQRKFSGFFDDATISSKKAEEALEILQTPDERACENRLLLLLEVERFDLVKFLMHNRKKISYCTRLERAKNNDDEKKKIKKEMIEDASGIGTEILSELQVGGDNNNSNINAWGESDDVNAWSKKNNNNNNNKEENNNNLQDVVMGVENAAANFANTHLKKVDLGSLEFTRGSRLMSNKEVKLPDKSWRVQKKGYEEVHVPAMKNIERDVKLVEITSLPSWAQNAFGSKIKRLNALQSKVYSSAFNSGENLLVCAPTGAGKTNVACLTMLQTIGQYLIEGEENKVDTSQFKMVYIAPMKALVQETVNNFRHRLAPYDVQVRELSGDQALSKEEIADTQLIVTTPEKWDIVTRKAGERSYTQLVKLIIIDEIHLLHDGRGPVLESLVARTLRQVEATQEHVRLVGLSATLPNYQDVAAFLRVNMESGLFFFDGSFRPVPLQQQYVGISEKKILKQIKLSNEITYEKIIGQEDQNQVLVFVHSRKDTAKTAKALRDLALERNELNFFVQNDSATMEILKEQAGEHVTDSNLKEILPYGLGIHHAGLNKEDRTLCEDLFRDGRLKVLVSTATLAWGVNLPAHCVIIKGTQIYSPEKGGWTELSSQDVMQMIGRAGRPGYDTKGEGVIITSQNELQFYLSLLNEQLPIESQYISKLVDHLNAEIVSGTVKNIEEATTWLGYTYYYVRMLQNPGLYGISETMLESDPTLKEHRKTLIHSAACILDQHGLIEYERQTGAFNPTQLGRISSYYYVDVDSISSFNEYLKPSMDDIGIFRLFASSNEFKNVTVRSEEKIELQRLLQRVPIPVKESIEEPSAKINVLLQAYISRLKLDGYALLSDMVYIKASAGRITRALLEIVLMRGWANVAKRVLKVCQMVERRQWSSQTPLRQFPGSPLPRKLLVSLEKKSLAWDRYFDLEPHDLGELIRQPKLGKKLYRLIHRFPKVELSAQVQPILRSLVKIDLTIMADFEYDVESMGSHSILFHIMVEDANGEKILHHEFFSLKKRFVEDEHSVTFTVPMFARQAPHYIIRVIADRWLNSMTSLPVAFDKLTLPAANNPPTEVLDLQPVSIDQIPNEFKLMFQKYRGIQSFNPVQTQSFPSLFEENGNVYIGAATGNQKIVCGEIALCRAFLDNPNARCVYLAALPEICNSRYLEWKKMFGQGLGKNVVQFTGETSSDLTLLKRGHIVISTCAHWDQMSRRWKQRKAVQNVTLVIVDELHMIGGAHGPTMEVIVSRIRIMEAHFGKKIRIVGLSAPVINASEVGNWMGAKKHDQYAFGSTVRPIPLHLKVLGFNENRFASRMVAMSKPCYNIVTTTLKSNEEPCLIFVPSRKQAQLIAIDMLAFSSVDSNESRFVGNQTLIDKVCEEQIKSISLKSTLSQGVGFIHKALDSSDRKLVLNMFANGDIRLLIAVYDELWSLSNISASMVVILECSYYDGRDHRYVDYALADVVEMIGHSGRPNIDSSGSCLVMCHKPKQKYFEKFIHTALPIESHLDHVLHNTMCAEVVAKAITNKQEAVDYLTWSFFYRRLTKNPNYYNLLGTSNEELSDHLSELVETTLSDLEESKCIEIENNDTDISPLNLGMISSYHYIQYTSIELYASSLNANTKLRPMLQILSASSEYETLQMRHGDDKKLRLLTSHEPTIKVNNPEWTEPYTKVNVLLQGHFSRVNIRSIDFKKDQEIILSDAVRLVRALVDVISSNGWFRAVLIAMELGQMVVQGQWGTDSPLLQIPHFDRELANKCKTAGVEGIFDIMDMEDEPRNKLLNMNEAQMMDVARFCNSYPSLDLEFKVEDEEEIETEDVVTLLIEVERDEDEEEEEDGDTKMNGGTDPNASYVPLPVHAPLYPKEKMEGWWLLLGNMKDDTVAAIKRISVKVKSSFRLDFEAPEKAGTYEYKLYLVCDSYLGCDQEYDVKIVVKEGSNSGSEEEESDDDEKD